MKKRQKRQRRREINQKRKDVNKELSAGKTAGDGNNNEPPPSSTTTHEDEPQGWWNREQAGFQRCLTMIKIIVCMLVAFLVMGEPLKIVHIQGNDRWALIFLWAMVSIVFVTNAFLHFVRFFHEITKEYKLTNIVYQLVTTVWLAAGIAAAVYSWDLDPQIAFAAIIGCVMLSYAKYTPKRLFAWCAPYTYLTFFAIFEEGIAVSALALFTAFIMMMNGGVVKELGHTVEKLTEGERSISWVMGPGIVIVHLIHEWLDMAFIHPNFWDRLRHFHFHALHHMHFGWDVAFTIVGIVGAGMIGSEAITIALQKVQQWLLRIRGIENNPRIASFLTLWGTFSLGAGGGESLGCTATTALLDSQGAKRLAGKEKATMITYTAEALSCSGGVTWFAAPPVAVIKGFLITVMGWSIRHLLLYTGIFCLLVKGWCAWVVSGVVDLPTKVLEIPMMNNKQRWHFTQLCILVLLHIVLPEFLGIKGWWLAPLFVYDVVLGLYVLLKKVGDHPDLPLTFGAMLVTFHLVAHEGIPFVEWFGMNVLHIHELPRSYAIGICVTMSFGISVVADNALATSGMMPFLRLILGTAGIGAIKALNSDYAAGLNAQELEAVLTATGCGVGIILGSLTAGVVTHIANAIVNIAMMHHYTITPKEWFQMAWKLGAGSLAITYAGAYFLAYIAIPLDLGVFLKQW